VCVDRPANDNVCLEYNCTYISKGTEKGIWEWQLVASNENKTCKTNECFTRTCHPTKGCINVDEICLSRNTDCFTYECDEKTMKCIETNHLIRNTTCTHEICVDGKIVFEPNLDGCEKLKTDKCLVANCVYTEESEGVSRSSYCNYSARPDPTDDPCIDYECHNANGTYYFTDKPHCYDGLYCTEDVCTVFGECKFKDVKCSEEIDMEGYPCFEARCKELPENETYKCVRKLIRNAYIDVCGNCIQEELPSGSDSSSEEEPDLLECTNAPPRPLLTEGLAAASVALIIIFAVLIGAGIAASSVIGTRTLIARARAADNQSAHSNPLFQENEAEMTNPAFLEDKEVQ